MENLLSYQGNAGLGLGSNPGIPAPDNVNLNQLASTARDLQLQDNQMNVLKYQQKQKDQAILRDAIDSGNVAMGEILPEYQPVFDAAKKNVEDFYAKNGDQLTKDTDKYRQYQGLVRTLKDVATHAQVNTKSMKDLQKLKTDEGLPNGQEEIQKFIDAQTDATKKNFWNQIQPFQKMHEFNMADINEIPETALVKKPFIDSTNPAGSYDTTTLDYGEILKNKYNNYLNDTTGEKADSYNKFLQKVQGQDPIELGKTLNSMDAQITRYNKDRGLKEGMPGYVPLVNRDASTGQQIIKEPAADFAAKWALANQRDFVTRTQRAFDTKLGTYQINKERANTDAMYKRALIGNMRDKTRAYIDYTNAKINHLDPEDQTPAMNEMFNRNLLNQDSLFAPDKTGSAFGFKNIPAGSSLPVLTIENGKPTQLAPIKPTKIITLKNGTKEYEGGYYVPQYMLNGKIVKPQAFVNQYNDFKKQVGKSWKGSFEDFLRSAIQNPNSGVDFSIKGANGTVDRKLSLAVQKQISNMSTKKGQSGIFEDNAPPVDEIAPETPTTENPIE